MNNEQLSLAINLFENKIVILEAEYKEKHKDDFQRSKMNRHINKKLKKEINGLIFLNLAYPTHMLQNSEMFKY